LFHVEQFENACKDEGFCFFLTVKAWWRTDVFTVVRTVVYGGISPLWRRCEGLGTSLLVGRGEGAGKVVAGLKNVPQGLKPGLRGGLNAKAEALAYLEATATAGAVVLHSSAHSGSGWRGKATATANADSLRE